MISFYLCHAARCPKTTSLKSDPSWAGPPPFIKESHSWKSYTLEPRDMDGISDTVFEKTVGSIISFMIECDLHCIEYKHFFEVRTIQMGPSFL